MVDTIARVQLEANSTQIKSATADLAKLEQTSRRVQRATADSSRAFVDAALASRGYGGSIGGANDAIRRLVVGFAGIVAVRNAIRSLASFEETMASLRGVAIRTTSSIEDQNAQFAALSNTARQLGATTRFTASQAAEGLLALGRAGFTVQESIFAVSATLNLAQAGLLSLSEASSITSNAVRQFGLFAFDASRAADVLISTANRANTDVRQLAEGLKVAGPVAGSLGKTIEETSAALGTMANAGIQASLGGTQLRGIMSALLGPTAAAQKQIEGLGLSLSDVNPETNTLTEIFQRFRAAGLGASQALEIFNRRNVAGALVLTAYVDTLEELNDANEKARGEATRLADIQSSTLVGSYLALKSAIEAVVIDTGEQGLVKSLKGVVNTATNVVRILAGMEDGLAKGDDAAQALASSLGLVTRGIIILGFVNLTFQILKAATAATSLAGAAGSLYGVLAANPFFAITAAVAALAIGFRNLRPEVTTTEELITRLGLTSSSTAKQLQDLNTAYLSAFDSGNKREQLAVIESQIANLGAESIRLRAVLNDPELADFGILEDIRKQLGGFSQDVELILTDASTKAFDAFRRNSIESLAKFFDDFRSQTNRGSFESALKEVQRRFEAGGFEVGEGFRDQFNKAFQDQFFRTGDRSFEGIRAALENAFDAVAGNVQAIALPADQNLALVEERLNTLKVQAEALRAALGLVRGPRPPSAEEIERRIEEAENLKKGREELGGFLAGLNRELLLRRALASVQDQQRGTVQRLFEANEALSTAGIFNPGIRQAILLGVREMSTEIDKLGKEIDDTSVNINGFFDKDFETLQFEATLNRASGAFASFVSTLRSEGGTLRDALRNLFDDILNNVVQNFAFNLLQTLAGGPGNQGFLARILGVAFGSNATPGIPPPTQSALGNLFLGGGSVKKFQLGGFSNASIIDQPTLFPIGGGRLGLAGEAGSPEVAIAPLDRGPGGKLGVNVTGLGGNRTVIVNMRVFANDAGSFGRNRFQIQRDLRSATRNI